MDTILIWMVLINFCVAAFCGLTFLITWRMTRQMEEKLGGAIEEVRKELNNPETYDKIAKHVQDAVGRTLKGWWANKFGQSAKAVDGVMEQMPGGLPIGLQLLKAKKEDRLALVVGYIAEKIAAKQAATPDQGSIPNPEEYAKAYKEAYAPPGSEKSA